MNTMQLLIDRYGKLDLDISDLSDFMRMTEKSILNAISAGRFPIKTAKKGRSRVADVRDVAEWWDKQRASA